MKERIKRFYRNHKTAVVVGASAATLAALAIARNRSDPKIVGVGFLESTDGRRLVDVETKNGDHYFEWIT